MALRLRSTAVGDLLRLLVRADAGAVVDVDGGGLATVPFACVPELVRARACALRGGMHA